LEKLRLDVPPIGVKLLEETSDDFEAADEYRGVSYCDAVGLAASGREVLVLPGSIELCKWSPVVLGLKKPGSDFEVSLGPRVEAPVAAVYLAPLQLFREGLEPDVVILRGGRARIDRLAGMMGAGALDNRYRGEFDKSALGVDETGISLKSLLTNSVNRALGRLRHSRAFDSAVKRVFKSETITNTLEKLIKRTMASMSVCRNSTVIPFLEETGNISFYCTGGVTWGGNSPRDVTSGFPYAMIAPLLERIDYPGK
jgi:uncharacterized protein (DUF169 family)